MDSVFRWPASALPPVFRRGTNHFGHSRAMRLFLIHERLSESVGLLEERYGDPAPAEDTRALDRLTGRVERLARIRKELEFVLQECP
jgi:hypothetical protein